MPHLHLDSVCMNNEQNWWQIRLTAANVDHDIDLTWTKQLVSEEHVPLDIVK